MSIPNEYYPAIDSCKKKYCYNDYNQCKSWKSGSGSFLLVLIDFSFAHKIITHRIDHFEQIIFMNWYKNLDKFYGR